MDMLADKAPPEFTKVAAEAYTQAYEHAHPKEVENVAGRFVRNAGWFKTSNGSWEQLAPDLREKVNIRKAIKQPDGNYLIQDVDVFYPNDVKGDEYSAERISDIISTSNSAINSGGQPPGIVREHPTKERKDHGIATPALGYGFGFEKSPRGKGWTRCNIIVSPDVYEEWKAGKWIGLSAGFACDSGGRNFRFAHLALLGGDMQALMHLPKVEVFTADNQLAFCADYNVFTSRGDEMPTPTNTNNLTAEQKKAFAALAGAHAKLQAAFAAYATDDPKAEAFDTEARAAFASAEVEYEAAFATGDEGNPLYNEHANTVVPDETELDALLGIEPQANTVVGAGQPQSEGAEPMEGNFSAENQAQFNSLRAELETSKKVIAGLVGKSMRQEFESFLSEKQREGHQFDAESIRSAFAASVANPEMVKTLRTIVERSPKNPLNTEPTFAAGEANKNINPAASPARSPESDARVLAILRKAAPNLTFSSDDIALGMTASNVTSE